MSHDECDADYYNLRTTVPRVASSLDDLRVGQVVALGEDGRWSIENVSEPPLWVHSLERGHTIIILSDPLPEPVSVSRAAIDRLAEVFLSHGEGYWSGPLAFAVDDLLAEVRAQEPTP